jgi:2-amino-4-hydroxy-6-hydroxymethyldihydropteridine diphosphokinase
MSRALVALGANLPHDGQPPEVAVAAAIAVLAERTGQTVQASRLYRTPAFPPGTGPEFVNAAVALDWEGTPETLLVLLHEIEASFGRTRQARWEARLMDLDLIALGDSVMPDAQTQSCWAALPSDRAAVEIPQQLILPHPRLADRSFVLVPLADVAPDWQHPVTGRSVMQMLGDRPPEERAAIRAMDADPADRTHS